jgi:D-tyrosyl-tRNA(Tyr) deacylase|tara:strand:+ start:3046 stop:3495 length:450 start_codon:yes stop_codon:yes gene_type:complete
LKALIQRVSQGKVSVDSNQIASISGGMVVLLGIFNDDTELDVLKVCKKILNLRIFNDSKNKINYNIKDISGEILLVSQFTLCANTKKGNRPSFINAMVPNKAEKLFNMVKKELSLYVETEIGQFGAMMSLQLTNEGPMTIIIDTHNDNK